MKPLNTASSLTDRVYSAILDEILDGRLEPGQHLVQEQLASALGVSRQPVQQSMALLKADGVVEEIGTRGLRVSHLDLTRMRHHYELRTVLDGFAAWSAASRVKAGAVPRKALEKRARTILSAGYEAIDAGAIREQIRHDEALHRLIYEISGNPLLADTAEPHWRFLRRAMADVLRHAEPPREIWDQHAAIVEAVLDGDPARAEALAQEHDKVAAETLSGALERREAAAGGFAEGGAA